MPFSRVHAAFSPLWGTDAGAGSFRQLVSIALRAALAARLGRIGGMVCTLALGACSQDPSPLPPEPPGQRVDMLPADERRVEVERGLDLPDSLSCETVAGVPAEGRLLTRTQYENSLRAVFSGLPEGLADGFPAETKVFFFGTNQEHHRITPLLAEAHMRAAESVVATLLSDEHGALSCEELEGADCAERLLDTYGPKLMRRPLRPDETDVFLRLYQAAAAEGDVVEGLRALFEGLLQAPAFLYRLEESGAGAEPGEMTAVGALELATRLSFLIFNGPPDAELLAAAESGALTEPGELEAQARRMLDDPRAEATFAEFAHQWLGTEALRGTLIRTAEDADTAKLPAALLESVDLFLRGVFASEAPSIPSLFSSPAVHLDASLSSLYDVDAPDGDLFRAVELEPKYRAGLLTQPALLALLAHPEQSSPVHRGVFVLDRLLCEPPVPPPPGLAVVAPDPSPYLTTRERFAVHTASAACSGCHQYIDPLGFAFEQFDHLGRLRLEENGAPVDSSGALVDTPQDAFEDYLEGPLSGARELGLRLAGSAQVQACAAVQWYQFAMGRVQRAEDLCSLITLRDQLLSSNGDLRQLMVGLVLTDAFRFRLATADPEASSE